MPNVPVRALSEVLLPRVAIVGAGIAGLACARELVVAGLHPRVLERNEVAGGRCSPRQTEVGRFDPGCPEVAAGELGACHPLFAAQVRHWIEHGVVTEWPARFVRLDRSRRVSPIPGMHRVGVPDMGAIAMSMAAGTDFAPRCTVRSAVRDSTGKWYLEASENVALEAFDAVLIATAAEHAAPLLVESAQLSGVARSVRTRPTWTLLAAFNAMLDTPFDVAVPEDDCIAWMGRDSSKPGRSSGERWVVHASPQWSELHLDCAPDAVREAMFDAMRRLTSSQAPPIFLAVQLYRYARVEAPAGGLPCLWDPELAIGACGDWLAPEAPGDGRPNSLASAYLSGRELGRRAAHALLGRAA